MTSWKTPSRDLKRDRKVFNLWSVTLSLRDLHTGWTQWSQRASRTVEQLGCVRKASYMLRNHVPMVRWRDMGDDDFPYLYNLYTSLYDAPVYRLSCNMLVVLVVGMCRPQASCSPRLQSWAHLECGEEERLVVNGKPRKMKELKELQLKRTQWPYQVVCWTLSFHLGEQHCNTRCTSMLSWSLKYISLGKLSQQSLGAKKDDRDEGVSVGGNPKFSILVD